MDIILSLKHNKSKIRHKVLRYIKGTILELHGFRSSGSFDCDMARFDKSEIDLLFAEIKNNLSQNKKTKMLCIIESQMSGLPHLTLTRNADVIKISYVFQGSTTDYNVNFDLIFDKFLNNMLSSLFEAYPELWVANNDTTANSVFIRYSYFNNGLQEFIEIVDGNGTRDIGKKECPMISCSRDTCLNWKIDKSINSSNDLNKTLNKFKSFIFELKKSTAFRDWTEYISNLNANGFSLDFRFKNERFECIDYDTSVYKKTIDDAIKINLTK